MIPMPVFEWILLLFFAAAVLANVAERLAVPYSSPCGFAFLPSLRRSKLSRSCFGFVCSFELQQRHWFASG
jgi:hypothetical protein